MRIKNIILIFLIIPSIGYSQHDTINQIDENGQKQGYWIYYGKDRSNSGYPDNGKIEEGHYVNNRKEGTWLKYHIDGETLKLKGQYIKNRPTGIYEIYYSNGNIKRKGCFINGNALRKNCTEYWYYETGLIEQKRTIDSTYKYFESGCLSAISTFDKTDMSERMIVQYYEDSCNIIKDTIYEYTNLCKGIIRETPTRDFNKENKSPSESVNLEQSKEHAPEIVIPRTKGTPFNPNSYNKVFNENDEVWQEGVFKDGRLWNGRLYLYDSDGILLKVKVFKKGAYHSDGQL